MTPTLIGRIQTRIALLLFFGVPWTIVVTRFLPGYDTSAGYAQNLRMTLQVLALVMAVGILWEFPYHLLQQFRWEKDWPSLFVLLLGIPEGIVLFFVARAVLDPDPPTSLFVVHFATTWIVVWLMAIGPIRMLLIRWRFKGGRTI